MRWRRLESSRGALARAVGRSPRHAATFPPREDLDKVILDDTRILVISYRYEDCRGNRGTGRPCTRASARDLPIARPTRPRGAAGRRHWRACGPCALVTDVPSAKSTARWTDYAAPREPSAFLLGRLRRYELAGQLLDRELLRQQRCGMFTELRAGSAG